MRANGLTSNLGFEERPILADSSSSGTTLTRHANAKKPREFKVLRLSQTISKAAAAAVAW